MKTNHTPGPWYWHADHIGNVSLRTPDRGNLIVMDFARKGMQGAAPRLAYWKGLPGGLPRERMGGILDTFHAEHPDALVIAAAPDLLQACADAVEVMERAKKLLEAAGFLMVGGTISAPYNKAIDGLNAALKLANPEQ